MQAFNLSGAWWWVFLAYICGAFPFSVWIGRLFLKKDIRRFGDANPGAANVYRAGGKASALLALLLDFSKGALPTWLACHRFQVTGWGLVAVAVAAVLGHALSPFLGFRGGKAVAVTGGVWCGLTLWEGPTVAGLLLGGAYLIIAIDGWAVIAALAGLVCYLLATPPSWNLASARPTGWTILATGIGHLLILAWTHRRDLTRPLALRMHRRQHARQ